MGWRESTIKYVKELLKPKTIREIIAKELKEAHLRKLEAESGLEYAKALVVYNNERIRRLQERLCEHTEEGDYT